MPDIMKPETPLATGGARGEEPAGKCAKGVVDS